MSTSSFKRGRGGNGSCTQTMCDIVARNKPDRTIGFVCDSIALFDQHFGQEYKEEIREMGLDALGKFGPGTPFERDERMLPVYRILAKYSKTMAAAELYDCLYEKHLFERSAQFYVDWASTHMAEGNQTKAAQIIAHAISTVGTGHPLLEQLKEKVDRVLAGRRLATIPEFVPSQPPPSTSAGPRAIADIPEFVPSQPPPSTSAGPRAIADIPEFVPSRPPPSTSAAARAIATIPEFVPSQPPPGASSGASRALEAQLADLKVGALVGRPPPLQQQPVQQPQLQHIQQPQLQHMQQPPPHSGAPARRAFGPIQAPARGAAAAAAAAARAAAEKEFPPLPSTSAAAAAAAEQPVLPPAPAEESAADNDDQENANPFLAAPFVFPKLSEMPPISPDMISPSLAQMKPGRPNQFILPPVFTFSEAATRPKDAQ